MADSSIGALVDTLRRCALLPAEQQAFVEQGLVPLGLDVRALVRELVQRGWLTDYQARELRAGRGKQLRLGNYLLLDRLGAGGMGEVFKARQEPLDRVIALKRIRRERLDSARAVRRFLREVRASARLDHPHIVRALAAAEVDGQHLLVMEFVEGTDLATLVEARGPLPAAQACDLVCQAARGLQHAHEQGMVHRDIKPSNLLLTPQGVLKVLDFGLARLARPDTSDLSSSLTREGTVLGTLDFLAPEQATDASAVDIRADLYSLGCTFYYLLAGQVPFPGTEPLAKLMNHRLEEPEPIERLRPDVPAGVAAVLRRLMAKKPEDRFPTPADLADTLAASSVSSAPLALSSLSKDSPFADLGKKRPSSSTSSADRPPWRRRRTVALLAAAAFLGLLPWLLRGDRGQPDAPAPSAPGRPLPPPLTIKTTSETVDLLARVVPAQHAVQGSWRFEGKALISPAGGYDRILLPYHPPAEYDLAIVARRLQGGHSLNLGIPLGPGGVVVMLHGWGLHPISGLERVGGKLAPDNPTRHDGAIFADRQTTRLTYSVRAGRIHVAADGRTIIDYRGPRAVLSIEDRWRTPDPRALFLGTYHTVFAISSIEVKPLSGPGKLLP
jgi:serine/threonine protein kinase